MTEAVIFVAAMLTLAIATLAAFYRIVRDAPPQPQQQCPRGTSNKEPAAHSGLS